MEKPSVLNPAVPTRTRLMDLGGLSRVDTESQEHGPNSWVKGVSPEAAKVPARRALAELGLFDPGRVERTGNLRIVLNLPE